MPLETNPWLNHPLHRMPEPHPHERASIQEYLRWMRIKRSEPSGQDPDQNKLRNNGEVLELLSLWEDHANYTEDFKRLSDRTQRLAHQSFVVVAPWRIRIGGQRGPESMLLPALNAQGLPYLPSTSLKGVARSVADQDPTVDAQTLDRIFGTPEPEAITGSVTFLDAYPLPQPQIAEDEDESIDEAQGLVPDMANALWTWGNTGPQYQANPNVFLSLRKVRFRIGLCRGHQGTDEQLEQVQRWLVQGLLQGIGSRVNSGYGVLRVVSKSLLPGYLPPWAEVKFELQGQLPHGRQDFNEWRVNRKNRWNPPGVAQTEIRPTAFRSLLRYWFRVLALGKLRAEVVQDAELEIFGGIEPKPHWGMVQVLVENSKIIRVGADPGQAMGTLVLRPARNLERAQSQTLRKLMQSLLWLMGHLGGVGQGARRPCYSRQKRKRKVPPYWRGTTLTFKPILVKSPSPEAQQKEKQEKVFWDCPPDLEKFQVRFQKGLQEFYVALGTYLGQPNLATQNRIVQPLPPRQTFVDALDTRSAIFVVDGDYSRDKPPALALLHHLAGDNGNYNTELCGSTNIPSPIWVARVWDRFDVVTVFGSNQSDRADFVAQLQDCEFTVKECLRVL